MKRIEEFIDSIYGHVVDHKEAKELKAEMRTHLVEAVEELQAEGKSEEEAVSIALERFGDEGMLRGKITEYFRVTRIFSVNVLRSAILFAVLGVLISCVFAYSEYQLHSQRESVMQFSLSVLSTNQEKSQANKETIVELAEKAPQVKALEIYPEDSSISGKEAFAFHNPEPFKKIMYWNAMEGATASNGSWRVDINFEHFQVAWINAIMVCFVAYWVLFAMWAMIQAYRQRRLHTWWIAAFALLNLPAYLVYRGSVRTRT